MSTVTKSPGLLPQPLDPRDLWEDELGGIPEVTFPKEHRLNGLEFEPQGAWPFCVAFSVTKMVENAITRIKGEQVSLSQPHLFFNSGGSPRGSTFRGNLNTAKARGCINYNKFPMPFDIWENDNFGAFREAALAEPFTDAKKILGYIRVNPDRNAIKSAILRYGMVMVGVAASGGYWTPATKRPPKKPDDHAILLVGWDANDNWWAFDSLQPSRDFNGYHTLHSSYEFLSVYAVTELPEDWKEKQAETRSEGFEHCLNHYGQQRDFEKEQKAAQELVEAFNRFNNESVKAAAGKFWTVLCNAVAYGGYSVSYTRFGLWQPGDAVNDIYHWRRTGEHIFDFNKPRSEYA